MNILKINTLRGPNYWSVNRQNLIQMELDICIYEDTPTNKIEGFAQKLTQLIPSLVTHHCSVGREGGFIERVQEGTWLGHVIEHVALELQCLAGMECVFGRTRSTGKTGVYHVVFSYLIENAGRYAAEASVRLVEAIAKGEEYDIKPDLQKLYSIYCAEKLGPSTQAIVDEAQKRGIPYRRLNTGSLVMLGQGINQQLVQATIAGSTSNIAVELVQNKKIVKQMLLENYIPVPKGTSIKEENQLLDALNHLGYPIVLKPIDGNHGKGVTTNIKSYAKAVDAFILAKQESEEIIIEQFIEGNDYRLLVVDYKFVAASKRTPANVTGDGFSTVIELIDEENANSDRGEDHDNILTRINIDINTLSILIEKNISLSTILPKGEVLYLKDTANISMGGTAEDVTHLVHPETIFIIERTARLVNLNICGIDVIAKDITVPLTSENGAVIELNAAPGIRMHLFPSKGKPRNVAVSIIDMLYPFGRPSRIPITAITGTNGKTTTTRLLAHLAQVSGFSVGSTTTDGIYLNNRLITHDDCSGPASAAVVLQNSLVNYAVLECARGGILRSGLGFDKCDISIVTNVSEDHLGMGGINDIETMARVKSIVPEATFKNGYAILNADDDLVYNMIKNISCNIALFSLHADNPRIVTHCSKGGLAAFLENGWLTILKGEISIQIIKINEIPITLEGKYDCIIQNVLAATLAANISDFSVNNIRSGLLSFLPELNPGRMNTFVLKNCTVIIDYAHNIGSYQELKKYMKKEKATYKIGIIAATGDRREQDIVAMGSLVSDIFDEIIIRHDIDGRGKTNEELSNLLLRGIKSNGYSTKKVQVISDEKNALQFAINNSPKDALIFLSSDDIHKTLKFFKEKWQLKENFPFVCNEGVMF